MVILKAGLSADNETSQYFKMANDTLALIISNITGLPLRSNVLSNQTVFMDWFGTAAS